MRWPALRGTSTERSPRSCGAFSSSSGRSKLTAGGAARPWSPTLAALDLNMHGYTTDPMTLYDPLRGRHAERDAGTAPRLLPQ